MCTKKKFIINPYTLKGMFVNCGHCPACLQEKALQRTNRIKSDRSQDGSTLTLFVTLTYDNKFVPYIIEDGESNELFKEGNDYVRYFPVKRDYNVRYFKGVKKVSKNDTPLFQLRVPSEIHLPDSYLRGQNLPKIGVCYYKDVQNFIKRLRLNLPNGINFRFYACSEYGPTSARPHFHLLLTIPSKAYGLFASAVVKSWPFADNLRTRQYIEVAKDAAAYVSSYVNCSNSLPYFYTGVHEISPSHSFSRGYGVSIPEFTFMGIWQAFQTGSLTYAMPQTISGQSVDRRFLIPRYAIYRAFPKPKGFAYLTSDEVVGLLLRPSNVRLLQGKMKLNPEDLHQIEVQLSNAVKRAENNGISRYDYAFAFPRIWSLRSSESLRQFYDNIKVPSDNLEAYDNLSMLGVSVSNYTLEDLASSCGVRTLNPNEFYSIQAKTLSLMNAYHSYSKDRKIRNYIYSQNHNF